MVDDSLAMADMNWRLVEDAKEAMSRGDWMLALSLFEQSRHICINEGWRDGVHYADDMILDIYPMVKRQIDDGNKVPDEKPNSIVGDHDIKALPHQQAYFHGEVLSGMDNEDDDNQAEPSGDDELGNARLTRGIFDEDPSNRRLRRMINPDKAD